jgi:hypothetical protein
MKEKTAYKIVLSKPITKIWLANESLNLNIELVENKIKKSPFLKIC